MCEYKQKHTPPGTHSKAQNLARIQRLALSVCWRVMIYAICNKNELIIQDISRFPFVGRAGWWCECKQKQTHLRGTREIAKTRKTPTPSSQYVMRGDDLCHLQHKWAHNSRDELILMCGMSRMCEYEPPKHPPSGVETTVQKLVHCFTPHKN